MYHNLLLCRCGGNASTIAANLQQLQQLEGLVTAAAYEQFNLGPNGTLVPNNLTLVGPTIASYGLQTHAMISSYPYPPQFIDWMRQVFVQPTGFIQQAVDTAVAQHFDAYNVDWEPSDGVLASDAPAYAAFLTQFADAMHAAGKQISVDVATWSPLWNLTLLAGTSVDYFMTMSTYTDNFTIFTSNLQAAVATLPAAKLVIGLETVRPSDGQPYTLQQMVERFQLLQQYRVQGIGIWDSPIPELWIPLLKAWAANA